MHKTAFLMVNTLTSARLLPSRRGVGEASGVRDRIAPGMEVCYVVRFKPDARIDYSYDLKVVPRQRLAF